MSEKTHWKKMTPTNYMGDYSIPQGSDLIAIIDRVVNEKVQSVNGKSEEKMVVYFSDGNKPLVLNKTNAKIIQKIYNSPYIEDWKGRAIQIYYDPTIRFGREKVGGLRVRPFIPQQQTKTLKCSDCKNDIKPAYGHDAMWVSQYTHKSYGKELCAECAMKLKAKQEEQQAPDVFGG